MALLRQSAVATAPCLAVATTARSAAARPAPFCQHLLSRASPSTVLGAHCVAPLSQRRAVAARASSSVVVVAMADQKVRGVVKWFNSSKGFGFISPDDGGADLFVHQTSIMTDGFRSLAEGEPVEFYVEADMDGRTRAVEVTGPNGAAPQGARRPDFNDDFGGGGFNRNKGGARGGRGGGRSRKYEEDEY